MKYPLLLIIFVLLMLLPKASKAQDKGSRYTFRGNVEGAVAIGSEEGLPYMLTQNQQGVLAPTGSQGYLRAQADLHYRKPKFYYGAALDAIAYAANPTGRNANPVDYYAHHLYLQQLYAEVGYGRYFLEVGSHEDPGNFVSSRLSSGNMIWSGNSRPIPSLRFGTREFVKMIVLAEQVEAKFDCSFGILTDGQYNNQAYDAYQATDALLRASAVDAAYLHRKSVFFRSNTYYPFFVTLGVEHAALYGGTIRHRDGDWDDKGGLDGQNTCQEVTYHQTGKWGNAMLGGTGRIHDALNQMMAVDMRLDLNLRQFAIGAYKQHYFDDLNDKSFEQFGDGLWGLELRFKKVDWLRHIVIEYIKTDSQGDNTEALRKMAKGEEPAIEDFASDFYQDERFCGYTHYGMACGSSMLTSPIYNADRYPGFAHNVMQGLQLGFEGEILYGLTYRCKLAHIASKGNPWSIAMGELSGHPLSMLRSTSAMLEAEYRFDNGLSLTPRLSFDAGELYGNRFGIYLSARYTFGTDNQDN